MEGGEAVVAALVIPGEVEVEGGVIPIPMAVVAVYPMPMVDTTAPLPVVTLVVAQVAMVGMVVIRLRKFAIILFMKNKTNTPSSRWGVRFIARGQR